MTTVQKNDLDVIFCSCASSQAMRGVFVPTLAGLMWLTVVSSGAAQSSAPLASRDAALATQLAELERPSRIWWASWIAVMGALTGGQSVLAALEDADTRASRGQRAAYITGASLSGAGLLVVLVTPMPGRTAHRRYLAHAGDDASRRALGDELLDASARAAARARSWLPHTVAGVLGLGVGLGLGLGYDDAWLGAKSGIGTALIVEGRAWTYPQRARRFAEQRGSADLSRLFALPLLSKHTVGLTLGFY